MKVLKIVSCRDKLKWYSDMVGYLVPLLAIEEIEYKSREPAGYINFVSKEDAEIIEVSEDEWSRVVSKWG